MFSNPSLKSWLATILLCVWIAECEFKFIEWNIHFLARLTPHIRQFPIDFPISHLGTCIPLLWKVLPARKIFLFLKLPEFVGDTLRLEERMSFWRQYFPHENDGRIPAYMVKMEGENFPNITCDLQIWY